jgi:hypothetical protein
LGNAGHRGCEIGIVGTSLDDRLLLDEGLIFSVEIESRLDRDRAVHDEPPFTA